MPIGGSPCGYAANERVNHAPCMEHEAAGYEDAEEHD